MIFNILKNILKRNNKLYGTKLGKKSIISMV